MKYRIDDENSGGLMKIWRECALKQISECSPRDVAALFDLGKRIPGMFLRHHVGVFGQAMNYMDQQKHLHAQAIYEVSARDLVAPFLKKEQIINPSFGYAQFVGWPRVEQEINYAYCSGLHIHPEALELARKWINKIPSRWRRGAERTLCPLNAPLMLAPSAQPVPQPTPTSVSVIDYGKTTEAPTPTIGKDTRLSAVEVPVVGKSQTPAAVSMPDPDVEWLNYPKPAPEPIYDVAKDLGENPQSAIIAGVPGAGKGMITSNALRALRAKSPEVKVMVIDPKADPKERQYWEGVCDVYRPRAFGGAGANPENNTEWFLETIEEFKRLPAPKLLVLDEGVMVCQTLKLAKLFDYQMTPEGKEKAVPVDTFGLFTNFLTYLSSMGDSEGVWIWFVSQIVNASDLRISGGMRSIFRAIAIVSPKNRNAVNTFFDTKFVPYPAGGIQAVYDLMDASPVTRAFYDGKIDKWMSMPELPNHSGWNRDKRESVSAPKSEPCDQMKDAVATLTKAGDIQAIKSIRDQLKDRVAMARLKGRQAS